MWQRFTLYDVRVIGHYLGVLVLFSSLALLVPFVTALACAEWTPATHYLLTIGIALIVGSALRFLRIDPGRLNRQQALAVTGFAWIVLAFVAAVPLYLSGHYLRGFARASVASSTRAQSLPPLLQLNAKPLMVQPQYPQNRRGRKS